ncbi:glycosyltransferase family 4 protein [Patescibacteria group bacterium]|nr:glycosyltransferase family 4 protein [Patescibacteria group bacterium]
MKPHIVILSAFVTPFRSGAEACVEEVPPLLRDKYDFTIVTARLRKDLPKQGRLENGTPVVRVGFGNKFDKWLYPFLSPFAVYKLKPNITHAVLESFAGLAMCFCGVAFFGAKRILTCQSTNTKMYLKEMHKAANKITCISNVLIKRAKKFGRDDAILIPNGIDMKAITDSLSWYEKVSGRILFVGRLEKMKGIDTLLQAVARIALSPSPSPEGGGELRLRIVGDGSQRSNLEKLTEDLGIKNYVKFLGYIAPPDVYKEYAQAEIFCGLSRREALGNVFLEAQAAGCAVLGTQIDGIPDVVIKDKTGLLIKPDNTEHAANELGRLLSDRELRKRLTEAGKKNAEKYEWGVIAGKYDEVYKEVLGVR